MEIMALEKGHKRLILCGKKLENMVFVQGMGVYSTIFFSWVSQSELEACAQAP